MGYGYYTVAPRYTCGSPALVPEVIAERVAKQEKDAYAYVLEGIEGEQRKALAERLGLRGIAEWKIEKGSGKKHGWEVLDLCTGERFFRLTPEALHKLGWRRYDELDGWERRLVDADPPKDLQDPTKGFYKLTPDRSGSIVGFGGGYKVETYRPAMVSV